MADVDRKYDPSQRLISCQCVVLEDRRSVVTQFDGQSAFTYGLLKSFSCLTLLLLSYLYFFLSFHFCLADEDSSFFLLCNVEAPFQELVHIQLQIMPRHLLCRKKQSFGR